MGAYLPLIGVVVRPTLAGRLAGTRARGTSLVRGQGGSQRPCLAPSVLTALSAVEDPVTPLQIEMISEASFHLSLSQLPLTVSRFNASGPHICFRKADVCVFFFPLLPPLSLPPSLLCLHLEAELRPSVVLSAGFHPSSYLSLRSTAHQWPGWESACQTASRLETFACWLVCFLLHYVGSSFSSSSSHLFLDILDSPWKSRSFV